MLKFLRPPCSLTLLSALCLLLSGAAKAQRLPANVVPENYKLMIDPEIAAHKFSGEETITVRATRPTSEILLNSLDLEITAAELTAGGTTQPAQVSYDKSNEVIRLSFQRSVPAGPASIRLKWTGRLTEGLRGLYLSKSPRREYAVTQFEGTYARMMFPCFDEPAFKATFDLSVMADKGDTAISNGRIIRDEPSGSRHRISFSISPLMSTYLVALAVGDWQCLGQTVEGTPIRVCAVPEKKEKGAFALETAAHVLRFYNQWYGIKYPFGKLDMVAIPDYEWGGMENTASIFYRDTALLLNEDGSAAPALTKRSHATVVAHEMAHQWFGDLVTAAWWDDIWLNEGFATWMERKPIEAWHPEWNLEEDATAAAQQIISVDSLSSARAIHGEPRTSSEIKEMFDGITYEKGGAVLRMLEAYLGPEVFRRGVNQYLKEHANGNATSADFWRAMTQVSGKAVDKIMPTFVMQPGVPVVSVRQSCQGGRAQIQLEQQRFEISSTQSATTHEQWQIPVCMKSPQACALLTGKSKQVEGDSCPQWVFANRDAKGYYRVAYSLENLNKVAAAEKELTAPERIALVEDTWAMTRAGRYPVAGFMNLAQALRAEQERHVIDLLAAHFEYLGSSLVSEGQETSYNKFVREQFAPLAAKLGWVPRSNDTEEQKTLRASLLQVMGEAGEPGAIAAAHNMVKQYLERPESVEANMTGPAFTVASQTGDAALYDKLHSAFEKTRAPDEYYHYLFALAGFRQPELVERTLQLVAQGKVRQQDYPALFGNLLANPAARSITWKYLKAHWDALAEEVTTFGGRGAVSALGNFCSMGEADNIKRFFSGHRAPGAEGALKQSLERVENCVTFKQLQKANMEKWLQQQR